VLQLFLVLVDSACGAKVAKETSRDKLLYIKPLSASNSSLRITWVKMERAYLCGLCEFEMRGQHLATSSLAILVEDLGSLLWETKNPTRFPSRSTVPFCVQPGTQQ